MRRFRIVVASISLLLSAAIALAQDSPAGRWRTIDKASGQPKSIVVVWEERGSLFGKVEKVFDPFPKESNPRCDACQGDLHDKPVIGMKILWDLSKHGDEWSGGKVFDPDTGKTYNCTLSLENGGSKLKLRGFIGMSLFGRTEYWIRER
jgi:uncharacterized protein (DUF2147 family)